MSHDTSQYDSNAQYPNDGTIVDDDGDDEVDFDYANLGEDE